MRGYELIRILLGKLAAGGYFSLHLNFAKDRRHLEHEMRHVQVYRGDPKSLSILEENQPEGEGVMSVYDYDLNKISLLLMRAGIEAMFTHFSDHGGCFGIVMCGRKRQ